MFVNEANLTINMLSEMVLRKRYILIENFFQKTLVQIKVCFKFANSIALWPMV